MIFEDHIRIVRFGAVQVWGHMVGGDQTVYEHTTWFKRAARRLLGHVPAIHADGEVEIVLDISHVFKKELVANLYDFIWTLMLWWTSPDLISQYMPSPPSCLRVVASGWPHTPCGTRCSYPEPTEYRTTGHSDVAGRCCHSLN